MGGPTSLVSDTIWGALSKPSVLLYIKKKKKKKHPLLKTLQFLLRESRGELLALLGLDTDCQVSGRLMTRPQTSRACEQLPSSPQCSVHGQRTLGQRGAQARGGRRPPRRCGWPSALPQQ